MSVIYKDGKITLDLCDIFDRIPADQRDEFFDRMSCESAVIKNVADQILTGYTEMASSGLTGSTSDAPWTPLDKATREVAKLAGDVAKNEIERLEYALKQTKEELYKEGKIRRLLYMKNYPWRSGQPRMVRL